MVGFGKEQAAKALRPVLLSGVTEVSISSGTICNDTE